MGSLDPLHYCNSRGESKRHYLSDCFQEYLGLERSCGTVIDIIVVLFFQMKTSSSNTNLNFFCQWQTVVRIQMGPSSSCKYQFNIISFL